MKLEGTTPEILHKTDLIDRAQFHRHFRPVAMIQGLYFVLFGLGSLLALRWFHPTVEVGAGAWVAQAEGVLMASVGAVLLVAALRHVATTTNVVLAIVSSLLMMGLDTIEATNSEGRAFLPMMDGLVQLAILTGWAFVAWRKETLPVRMQRGIHGELLPETKLTSADVPAESITQPLVQGAVGGEYRATH